MKKNSTLTKKQKIAFAAKLLQEVASATTDATAFEVIIDKRENGDWDIELVPDTKRRNSIDCLLSNNFGTFYHSEFVSNICGAFKLASYITYSIKDEIVYFKVRIY